MLTSLLGIFILATALIAAAESFWVFDLVTHFTPQLLCASLALGIAFCLRKCFMRAIISIIVALFFAQGIWAYIIPERQPKSAEVPISRF